MLKTIEMKLYLTSAQEDALSSWMRTCCWLYNKALDQRIKSYRRRGESVNYYDQCKWLTLLRKRMPSVSIVPAIFGRGALRRVDHSFQQFFRRCKSGEKCGFPRFRSWTAYKSLEYLSTDSYVRPNSLLFVPGLGLIRFRAGNQIVPRKQKILRIIRRASSWYAQIVVDDGQSLPSKIAVHGSIGIDLGLDSFATLSNGEKIENPRFLRASEVKLKRAQRQLSRKAKGSHNRRKAIRRVGRVHERIREQRRNFAHQESRKLVNRFDLIGFENLSIKGLSSGMLAKSVSDAAWGMFLFFMTYKAESAGRHAVAVDPRGTSQECPQCGSVKPKDLSERMHRCENCGLVLDRDEAAARIIHARALGVAGVVQACGGNGHCDENASVVSQPGEAGRRHGVKCH